MVPTPATPLDLGGEDFVNVLPDNSSVWPPSHRKPEESKDFYSHWLGKVSAPVSLPTLIASDALKRLHPNHSLVITEDYKLNILNFPGAQSRPLEKSPLITETFFVPLARRTSIPGVLVDAVQYGIFKITWQKYEFVVYIVTYPVGMGNKILHFILHEGPEEASRLFLSSIGAWSTALHDEIWVFNKGFWSKSHPLWKEVQKANWKDIILKDDFKEALQKDIYGFFNSEAIYKELVIPWKRGLIMFGPPGNGKTITLKAVMKSCGDEGFIPLYVKSFQSWLGEEAAMSEVFTKARELSPCVVILEDLDSLINDKNRSFFLNQLDGLDSNDGLLILGTTNHFEKLDAGLSARPSRFDRKYLFDDPDEIERKLYAQYWQNKLSSNKHIQFPDRLVDEFASLTSKFSFAYLKEAFVASLVLLAGLKGKKPTFESVLKDQVAELRKQLGKSKSSPQWSSTGGDVLLERSLAPFSRTLNPGSDDPRRPQFVSDDVERGSSTDKIYCARPSRSTTRDTVSNGGFWEILRTLPVRPAQRLFSTSLTSSGDETLNNPPSGERNFRDLIDRTGGQDYMNNNLLAESGRVHSSPPTPL